MREDKEGVVEDLRAQAVRTSICMPFTIVIVTMARIALLQVIFPKAESRQRARGHNK